MSKLQIIFMVAALILTAGILTGALWYFKSNKKIVPSVSLTNFIQEGNEKISVGGDVSYSDPSGFSFKYPTGFAVNELSPSDETYYSSLSVTKGSKGINISVMDTTAQSVDAWAKASGKAGLTLVGATTMGGMKAKQYKSGDNLVTAAVDSGVVYVVEGPKDGSVFEDTQNVIVSTFAFEDTGSETSAAADDTTYEEDVVE